MTTLHERIETALPIDDAFAFVADFANAAHWDPGVATLRPARPRARRGRRPVSTGRSDGRPGRARWTTWSRPSSRRARVVLDRARARGVAAVDDIRFETTPTGTRIDYTADIRLRGLLRLAAPFAGRRVRADRPRRTRRHAAGARPPRDRGLSGDGHRDHRLGDQRPERGLGAPPGRTGSPCSRGRALRAATSRP